MSLPQIKLFIEATQAERNRELRELTLVALAGARYEKESIDKWLDQLE